MGACKWKWSLNEWKLEMVLVVVKEYNAAANVSWDLSSFYLLTYSLLSIPTEWMSQQDFDLCADLMESTCCLAE